MSQLSPGRVARPAGVTVVIVLMWINAILEIIFGLVVIAFSGNLQTQLESGFAQGTLITIGVIGILIGLLTILFASGLARGSNGIRMLVTVLIVVQIVMDIFEIYRRPTTPWGSVVTILIWLVILGLLWTSRASAFFKQR